VLVVDDDAQTRSVLSAYLRRLGHQVLEAPTIAEGRALSASESPDLTIVDHHLPDGTAFDLIGSKSERENGEAVIVLTGVGTIELAVRAIKAGAEHFLTKPRRSRVARRPGPAQRSRPSVTAESSSSPPRTPTTSRIRSSARAPGYSR